MIKAIIFDMDGLMFDTERVFVHAWDYAGEKTGIGKAGYMVMKTLGASISATSEIWKKEYGAQFDVNVFRKHSKEFISGYYQNHATPIKDGLYELLDYLKSTDYLLGISTSSSRQEVDVHLKSAGLTGCFHAIADRDLVENSKPAPDLYLKACTMLDVIPAQCIALEDSKNGFLSACSAGCKTIMIPDLWQPDESIMRLLFACCNSLNDVIPIIAEIQKVKEEYEWK
jgi:HAD superfamily hydrolase (TIGR01509 family)